MEKTKKGQVTSRKTTYVHGDERYDIEVDGTSVSFTIFHKDVKKQHFCWRIDFAIEVALIILKGMNRELLIQTLISLQDFHPGSFVVPSDYAPLTEEDYASMEKQLNQIVEESIGIPLEDVTTAPAEMGSEYDEGFRIALSTPFFLSYSSWSLSSGINASDEFQKGFADGLLVKRGDAIPARPEPTGLRHKWEPSPLRQGHQLYPVVRSFANMLLAFPASHFSKAICGLELIDWEGIMELPLRKLMQDVVNLKTGESAPIGADIPEGQARIRTILDVLYDLADVPVEQLQENLEKGIAHLFSIGAITLDSAAEVASWECKTVVNPGKPYSTTVTGRTRGGGKDIFGYDVLTPTRVEVEGFDDSIEVPAHIREMLYHRPTPHPAG